MPDHRLTSVSASEKRLRPQSNAARERSRVKTLRSAFLDLQRSLPAVPPNTKLSKLDVLVLATAYIYHLTRTLEDSCAEPPQTSVSFINTHAQEEQHACASHTFRESSFVHYSESCTYSTPPPPFHSRVRQIQTDTPENSGTFPYDPRMEPSSYTYTYDTKDRISCELPSASDTLAIASACRIPNDKSCYGATHTGYLDEFNRRTESGCQLEKETKSLIAYQRDSTPPFSQAIDHGDEKREILAKAGVKMSAGVGGRCKSSRKSSASAAGIRRRSVGILHPVKKWPMRSRLYESILAPCGSASSRL